MSNCSVNIENIAEAESCANNMSGVNTLYFARKKDVVAINALRPASTATYSDRVVIGSSSMSGKAVTFATGKGFAKMYCSDDLGELKYVLQGPSGCRSMKAQLEIFHPGFKEKILGFLGSHLNEELIVVALLNNGEYHMLGDKNRGAKIADSTEATSGKAVSDPNGATIHFEWNTPAPQIFFEGWNAEDSENGLQMLAEAS